MTKGAVTKEIGHNHLDLGFVGVIWCVRSFFQQGIGQRLRVWNGLQQSQENFKVQTNLS